jgi:hypothetical protein
MPHNPWWSRLLCRLGNHDWRGGPGYPCVLCGAPDELFGPPPDPEQLKRIAAHFERKAGWNPLDPPKLAAPPDQEMP